MRHIISVALFFLSAVTAVSAHANTENIFLNLPQQKCKTKDIKIAAPGNIHMNIPELPHFTVLRLKTFEGIFDLPNA